MNDFFVLPGFAFIPDDDMIYVFFKDTDIRRTTIDGLKNGYNGWVLVDSEGKVFRIKRAFFVKYLGFYGWNPMVNLNPFSKGDRKISVDFEYESEIKKISLKALKTEVVTRINKRKEIWESAWEMKELQQEINNCNSFEEMAELLK